MTWHKNGNRKEELRTHKGQLHRIVWSPAGQKIHETNGNTVSEWRIDGTQKSEQIRLRDGQVQMTEHHLNGSPASQITIDLAGKHVSPPRTWFDNGNLKSENHWEGEKLDGRPSFGTPMVT